MFQNNRGKGKKNMQLVFELIVALILWQCTVSQGVMKCPDSTEEWLKASITLQCREPNYYHCLRDENNQITQKCLKIILIQKDRCPEFNTRVRRLNVYHCKSSQNNCPTTSYWSNEVYKYPGCFPNTSSKSQKSTSISGGDSEEKKQDNTTIIIVVAVCAGVIIILILSGVIIWRIRRKGENRGMEHANSEHKGTKIKRSAREKDKTDVLLDMKRANSNSEDKRTNNLFISRKDETDGLLETSGNNLKMETKDKLKNVNEKEQVIGSNQPQSYTDAVKLEKNGVIIFISDDTAKNHSRMNSLDFTGRFGKSLYLATLSLWDLEEDISLYLFRHSLNQINSAYDLIELTEKLEEMHKQVTQSPKIYFALSFHTDEWRRYEKDLLKYNFFRKASKVRL